MSPVLLVLRRADNPAAWPLWGVRVATLTCRSMSELLPNLPFNKRGALQCWIPKMLWWDLRDVFKAEIVLTDYPMGIVTQMVGVRAWKQLHLLLCLPWSHSPGQQAGVSCQPGWPDYASFITAGLLCCAKFPGSFPGDWAFTELISWYLAPEKVPSAVVCRVCPSCCSILWV